MPNFAKLTGSGAVASVWPNTAVRRISRVSRAGTERERGTHRTARATRRGGARGVAGGRRYVGGTGGGRVDGRRRVGGTSGGRVGRAGGREDGGRVGGRSRRAESAGGVGGRSRHVGGIGNKRTGAAGAVGASGMSASGLGVGVWFVEVPGSIPPKVPFWTYLEEIWTDVEWYGRSCSGRAGCGPTWRCPRLHSTASDEARRWLVGKPRISASKRMLSTSTRDHSPRAGRPTARVVISPPWVAIREATTPKIFAAEKIVRYRAICMALDVSPRNTSAAVPVVQPDPRLQARQLAPAAAIGATRETAKPKTVAAEKNLRRRRNREIPRDLHGA